MVNPHLFDEFLVSPVFFVNNWSIGIVIPFHFFSISFCLVLDGNCKVHVKVQVCVCVCVLSGNTLKCTFIYIKDKVDYEKKGKKAVWLKSNDVDDAELSVSRRHRRRQSASFRPPSLRFPSAAVHQHTGYFFGRFSRLSADCQCACEASCL